MKKILALLLVLSMCLGLFTGCNRTEDQDTQPTQSTQATTDATDPTETTPEADAKLDKALEYLRVFYKSAAEKTPMDYKRLGQVRIGTDTYAIVWSVDVDENIIKIVENKDGTFTIDINEKAVAETTEPIPYVLTATITGTDGREVTLTWKHVIPAAIDDEAIDIIKAAYALQPGQSLDGTHTLTGKIISIDTMYDAGYKNITVTIEVGGAEDMPIKCYRLKGEGADKLAVGDTITVTGTLTNYNGEIEFAQGCVLDAVESGGGTAPVAPENPAEILEAAFSLAPGKSLPYPCTLTGTITSVEGFVDTDTEVEKRCGCAVKELIATKGEAYFRDVETAVIRDLSAQDGHIIATGGGAVLREENVRHLKRNGRLFCLDAPLSRLCATADRPLSDTADKLAKLYDERMEIYRTTADVVVPMTTPEQEAAYILTKRMER